MRGTCTACSTPGRPGKSRHRPAMGRTSESRLAGPEIDTYGQVGGLLAYQRPRGDWHARMQGAPGRCPAKDPRHGGGSETRRHSRGVLWWRCPTCLTASVRTRRSRPAAPRRRMDRPSLARCGPTRLQSQPVTLASSGIEDGRFACADSAQIVGGSPAPALVGVGGRPPTTWSAGEHEHCWMHAPSGGIGAPVRR